MYSEAVKGQVCLLYSKFIEIRVQTFYKVGYVFFVYGIYRMELVRLYTYLITLSDIDKDIIFGIYKMFKILLFGKK